MFLSNKKSQVTTLSPATKLIGVIILGVVLLLIIYFAFKDKLTEILVSNYI